jgi:hypothetical protein
MIQAAVASREGSAVRRLVPLNDFGVDESALIASASRNKVMRSDELVFLLCVGLCFAGFAVYVRLRLRHGGWQMCCRSADDTAFTDGDDDDDDDYEEEEEMYRVLYSSNPTEIGYGSAFGGASPVSTLISVETARASKCTSSFSSSSWNGDYFDKFDV